MCINVEKIFNKIHKHKCPMLRVLGKYEIFLWLKYFWSYKQIFALPSFLNTLYFLDLYVPVQNYRILGYLRKFFIYNMATNSYNQIIFWIFWMNNVKSLKILLNDPKKIIKQKVVGIIFYPKKHPSQSQNLKSGLKGIFFLDTLYVD